MKDLLTAAVLFLGSEYFLYTKSLEYLGVWLIIVTVVLKFGARMSYTAAVLIAMATVLTVIWITGQSLRERFEEKEKDIEEEKRPSKKEEDKEPEPHMDIGSTLIEAYKKLKPTQVEQMSKDTKELMETQKQLMSTLSSLAPQVQQGAELVKSFQGMFGGNIAEVLKK